MSRVFAALYILLSMLVVVSTSAQKPRANCERGFDDLRMYRYDIALKELRVCRDEIPNAFHTYLLATAYFYTEDYRNTHIYAMLALLTTPALDAKYRESAARMLGQSEAFETVFKKSASTDGTLSYKGEDSEKDLNAVKEDLGGSLSAPENSIKEQQREKTLAAIEETYPCAGLSGTDHARCATVHPDVSSRKIIPTFVPIIE